MKPLAFLSVVLGAAGVLASCGGKIVCADGGTDCAPSNPSSVDCTKTACPNDPPITPSATAQCKAELASSCGAAYTSLYQCLLPLVKCDAAGKLDPSYSTDALTKCNAQIVSYQSCKSSPSFDAGK